MEAKRQVRRVTRRKILLRQLRARFGDLPEPVVARIEAGKSKTLDGWLDRVITAPSLDDVFREA